ncbi:hypothetical protein HID58_012978, partial [Brassica napus]
AKKRKDENARHMAKLRRIIIACNVHPSPSFDPLIFSPFSSSNLQTFDVVYVIVRMVIFHSSFTWKHWIGLVVTSIGYGVPYKFLDGMAKPSVSDDGELIDGGFDMSTGGICGILIMESSIFITSLTNGPCRYLHDVLYITCFVQLASIISGKFWYTYLVIPAFGAYKASGLIRGFMSQGSEGGVEDEKTRKKREKMERKASRGQAVRTRSR